MPRSKNRISSRDEGATFFGAEPEKAEAVESASDHNNNLHEHEYLSGSRLILVLSGLTLAVFLMLLDASIVATAVPTITSDFHSLNDIGWYGTAYLMTK
ncbi:hypothetical protein N0V82_003005 [Gnomoniopsis sp. IMI 355080]|nr:hypothetical protein N0V82_003005 [Gnomoniopsis sp. IMI 355080]